MSATGARCRVTAILRPYPGVAHDADDDGSVLDPAGAVPLA